MSERILTFSTELYEYVLKNTSPEDDVLKQLRIESEAAVPGLAIFPEQGQFMAMLVRLMGAKKTLDIGSFRGYSALSIAAVLPQDGTVIACEVNKKDAAIAEEYWKLAGVDKKIELHLGPALVTLDRLLENGAQDSFDFAFIDADKRNNQNYYDRCLQLLRPGGLMAIDNTLWGGRVVSVEEKDVRTDAIARFNQNLSEDDRTDSLLLPSWDGLSLAIKK